MKEHEKKSKLYNSLKEFVDEKPETRAAQKIITIIDPDAETLSLKISPSQPHISIVENDKIYWNVPGCLPGDVFIRGSMHKDAIVFPVEASKVGEVIRMSEFRASRFQKLAEAVNMWSPDCGVKSLIVSIEKLYGVMHRAYLKSNRIDLVDDYNDILQNIESAPEYASQVAEILRNDINITSKFREPKNAFIICDNTGMCIAGDCCDPNEIHENAEIMTFHINRWYEHMELMEYSQDV